MTTTHEGLIEQANRFRGLPNDGRHALQHQSASRRVSRHTEPRLFIGTVEPGNDVPRIDIFQGHELEHGSICDGHLRPGIPANQDRWFVGTQPNLFNLESKHIALPNDLDAIVSQDLPSHFIDHLRGLGLLQPDRDPINLALQGAFDLEWQFEDIAEHLVYECRQLDILNVEPDIGGLVIKHNLVTTIYDAHALHR
ncbi:hypothetical protein D3C80_1102220 [compost metagenome]